MKFSKLRALTVRYLAQALLRFDPVIRQLKCRNLFYQPDIRLKNTPKIQKDVGKPN
jgi:hypothetical protein